MVAAAQFWAGRNVDASQVLETAAAWSAWVTDSPPPAPVPPAPPAAHLGAQVARAVALVAASVMHEGEGPLDAAQLIALAKPLTAWAVRAPAASVAITIEGDPMPLTVDSTNAVAVLSFTDDHGDPVAPPEGTLSTATSDNTAILGVGAAVAGADATTGIANIQFPLSAVAAGSANLSVASTAADGSPLLGPDGATPIADPAPVAVTVNPGAAAAEMFSVPGA